MKQSAAIDLAQLFSNDQGICENGTQEETFPAAMNMMNKLYIYICIPKLIMFSQQPGR
jgi:hypothetical protein